MGMMPADRELKWQQVFRRFGLPGSLPEKDAAKEDENRTREDNRARGGVRDKTAKPKTDR